MATCCDSFSLWVLEQLRPERRQPDVVLARYNTIRSSQNNQINLESGGLLATRTRARVQKTLDADYALTLSADAVPALLEVIAERKADPAMNDLLQVLSQRWNAETPDWRSWKWGVARAKQAVTQNQ